MDGRLCNMVEFEKNILDLLDCYLMDEETTSFYCGSLFVECGMSTRIVVESSLSCS